MKDNFSAYADQYARFRPGYPKQLFSFLAGLVGEKELAWDCGTGNGQSAVQLSKYFKKVFATDLSNTQLANAGKSHNIEYVQEPAEKTSLGDNSVNLVTISQALHWFHFPDFYAEVRRTAKKDAVIAAWTYSLLEADAETNLLLAKYHFETLENYWDPERAYVNDGYASIPFPFTPITTPTFFIEVNWNPEELQGYVNTWSATQKFIAANNVNPVNELIGKIRQHWPQGEKRCIRFPLHIKAGYVH